MKSINMIIGVIGTFMLSACSIMQPVNLPHENKYLIDARIEQITQQGKTQQTVLVMPVTTTPLYNTTAILYSDQAYEMKRYAQARWAETPAQMLQTAFMHVLQQQYRYVVTAPYTGRYDRVINITLNKLYVDETVQPHVLRLDLQTQLLNAETQSIINSQVISIAEPLKRADIYQAVLAANAATEKALQQFKLS